MNSSIEIHGARTHNLKNISLSLPRNKLIVITGLSGSGKSSLAFDTLYAEGQRRYVESLSAYARQFLSIMEKPDVDHIEGLSPAISIQQKSTSHNPRSTVGTVTEIYDYLRLLFARVGTPQCPTHGIILSAKTISQLVDLLLREPEGTKIMLLAPVVRHRKGEYQELLNGVKRQGFVRVRINGALSELDAPIHLARHKKHTIEIVVDRLTIRADQRLRLAESLETTSHLANGLITLVWPDSNPPKEQTVSVTLACPECGYSLSELEPRLFSFNNPTGACAKCDGLGVKQSFDLERIISKPTHSLAAGAIKGWDIRTPYYYQMLLSLSRHYHFDIETPFQKLSAQHQHLVLYGSENEPITFSYTNDKGVIHTRKQPFEGIIPNFERRYQETESEVIRTELSQFLSVQVCKDCLGTRLIPAARHVFIEGKNLPQITALSIEETYQFLTDMNFSGSKQHIATKILKEVTDRLWFLLHVGLEYLSLDRSADTLSGGEAQRIRLASQIGSGLVGVLYILDEPSIGLHQRDNDKLLATLKRLRDLGNTVIVVEHDEEAIESADYLVDMGPGAGIHGGWVVAAGTKTDLMRAERSITGAYLARKKTIPVPLKRIPFSPEKILYLKGATGNNLKKIDVQIPIGLFTCVTGVSGSGKSTLVNETLYPLVAQKLYQQTGLRPAPYNSIVGLEYLDKVVDIDQSPIGRTPRSNPATYTGLFTPIRELFSETPEARSRGYALGRFSFNVKGGRCEACEGEGVTKVEMHFLPDLYVTCDVCQGKRFNRETLDIHYKGKNIHDVLQMAVEEASVFFSKIPVIARKLQTLTEVGLSYVQLGQSATTLSGGEAQRIKLAKELSKRDTGKTLYILDEPTTGLHFHDIHLLLEVLHRLRDAGNTIVVIEHNLDVIKTADWVIDLGPEGGHKGGQVVATGTPEDITGIPESYTGQFLQKKLNT